MNRIIIERDELEKIRNYEAEHYFENFIFDNFKIILKHDNFKVIYKIYIDGNIIKINYRMIQDNSYKDYEFIFEENEEGIKIIKQPHGKLIDTYINNMVNGNNADMTDEEILNFLQRWVTVEALFIRAVKQYIMNESYNRKVIYKESCRKGDVTSNGHKRSTNVKNPTVQFLLDDIINYVSYSGRKHGINCECWGVRGHFRHLRSGRVIWINSYEKGKARNTNKHIVSKLYTI